MSSQDEAFPAIGDADETLKFLNADHRASAIRRLLSRLAVGELRVTLPGGAALNFSGERPGLSAMIALRRWRALRRVLFGGDIGFAEGYVDGDWTTNDLVSLIRLALGNFDALDAAMRGSAVFRLTNRLRHWLRPNSRGGSRANIISHYDLGNDFYRLWLDPRMVYSSAIYDGDMDLEAAQARKLERVGSLLDCRPGARVLEIGCGWGALAEHLARAHGADVTALTLSPSQLRWAKESAAAHGVADKIDYRLQDYRDVQGAYDRIVSIEMIEAVGEAWWPTYFGALMRRLAPDGRAVIQAITIADERYPAYRQAPDFIQKHIFPGGFLPSKSALREQVALAGLRIAASEAFGESYARTLAAWRRQFHARWRDIAAQGFDDRFRRLWDYYLAYCEAAFAEGAVDVGLYTLEPAASARA